MSEEALLPAMSLLGRDLVADVDVALLEELCTGGDAMVLADLDWMPTGLELAARLDALDVKAAGGWDLVEAAAGLERLISWAQAKQASVLAALAARAEMRPDGGTGYGSVSPVTNTAVEVAARTVMTARQAEHLVGHAVQLVEDFPSTHAVLSAGVIDLRRARVITDELGGQDPQVRARVEAAVLPDAPDLDSVALRKLVKKLLHELAPVETAERCALAREGRYVTVTPTSDGMAFLEARLPAEDAIAWNTALDVAAADAKRADAAAGASARSKDQRRADALAELGWAALSACADAATGHPNRPAAADAAGATRAIGEAWSGPVRRRAVAVHVTIPFGALAGLSDEPGELDGYGPIPAHVARQLAAEGVWTWLRTDPGTGRLLDLGRTRYRPTTALADFIVARDRTCRTPGCHRPAKSGDIDHIDPFAAGGCTDPTNCHCLCRTHHLLKHHGNWTVTRDPDGTTRWRSPTGHYYTRPPDGQVRIGEARPGRTAAGPTAPATAGPGRSPSAATAR